MKAGHKIQGTNVVMLNAAAYAWHAEAGYSIPDSNEMVTTKALIEANLARPLYLVLSFVIGYDRVVLTEEALDLVLSEDPHAHARPIPAEEAAVWCTMPLTADDVGAMLGA